MRTFRRSVLLLILVFCYLPLFLSAQGEFPFQNSKNRIGATFGYGDQRLGPIDLAVNYHYDIHILQLNYFHTFLQKEKWNMELSVQPHYAYAIYKFWFTNPFYFYGNEVGLSGGILARLYLFDDFLSPYLLLSAGINWINGTPSRQSDGFVFTENIFSGVNLRLYRNYYLDLNIGFRHLSNAGIWKPNAGLNNIIINAGFMVNLLPR